jgi:hypothetical protein
MKQHVVAAGHGPDYDWSQDHISVTTPIESTDGGLGHRALIPVQLDDAEFIRQLGER